MSGRSEGPGSRGATIKADSAVIFTAHCITALRCCIPHSCGLNRKVLGSDCAAEEERGQSLKQEGDTTLPSALRTHLLGFALAVRLHLRVKSAMGSLGWCSSAVVVIAEHCS